MKAVVKPEFVGQHHPVFGVLTAGVVYEVESLGALFAPAKKDKPPEKDKE